MSEELRTALLYLKKLHNRYFHALVAFYLWEEFEKCIAPNIVGLETAKSNVKKLARYNSFFQMSRKALHVYYLLELAKIIDHSKQSLHITKFITYIKNNRNRMLRGGKPVSLTFEEISNQELQWCKQKDLILRIMTHRDQVLAHSDVEVLKVSFNRTEIFELFKLIQDTLNFFLLKLDDGTTLYSHIEEQTQREVKSLLEVLKR